MKHPVEVGKDISLRRPEGRYPEIERALVGSLMSFRVRAFTSGRARITSSLTMDSQTFPSSVMSYVKWRNVQIDVFHVFYSE